MTSNIAVKAVSASTGRPVSGPSFAYNVMCIEYIGRNKSKL